MYAYAKNQIAKALPTMKRNIKRAGNKSRIGKNGFSKAKALVFAAIFAGIGAYIITSSFAATPGTANLWVDANGGSCTRQSTAGAYNDAQACISMSAAWTAASAGDTVIVKGATDYTTGEIGINSTLNRNPAVNFKVAEGELVSVSGSGGEIGFSQLQGINIDGSDGLNGMGFDFSQIPSQFGSMISVNYSGSQRVKRFNMQNFKIHMPNNNNASKMGTVLAFSNCDSTSFKNFEMYHIWGADGIQSLSTGGHARACDGVDIDNAYIHDFNCTTSDADHQDAYQGFAGSNITIKNSTITDMNCSGGGAGTQGWFPNPNALSDSGATNNNFINNLVYDLAGATINVGESDAATIMNNTLIGTIGGTCDGAPCGNSRIFKNNIVSANNCSVVGNFYNVSSNGGYGYNILPAACSFSVANHDTIVSSANFNNMFVNAAGGNYHLASNSAARGAADPAAGQFTATDIEGNTRDSDPDAGAYEYGGAPPTDTPPSNSGGSSLPAITGTTTVGSTLTTTAGTWSGSPTPTYTYQWQRCNSSGAACSNIGSATATTYTLVSGDSGSTLRSVVTATNSEGSSAATSNATAVVGAAATPPSPVGTPTITGTLRVSSTLSAGNTTWNGTAPITYTYQWQRCDSAGTSSSCVVPTTPTGINTTSSTYALTCADYDKTLRLVIKGTNATGNASATTAISTAIQKPSTPVKGDFDDNCYINASDISAFVAHWRLPVGVGNNNTYNISGPALGNPPDLLIDSWDLNLLVSHYGYGG